MATETPRSETRDELLAQALARYDGPDPDAWARELADASTDLLRLYVASHSAPSERGE